MSQAPEDALDIWLNGAVVATLTLNRRRAPQLRYRPEYVGQRGEGALGLSLPLPVASRPYRGDLVDYWIESLLPEGETRTVLEQYFRVRRGDGFGLLRAIGRDCAGAVAVLPPTEDLAGQPGAVRPMTTSEATRTWPLTVTLDSRLYRSGR
jgi:serine/threonine-protein kinase HipA